jgi:lipoprotein-releasing system ATP-binding protein
MSSIVRVRNLVKTFKIDEHQSFKVLDDISFDVKRGEIFGIMGESGAGKSTLLNILGTLDKADSGSIEIDMSDISNLKESEVSKLRNERISFVFQNHHLLPEFNVIQNVMMPLLIRSVNNKDQSKGIELLKRFGLEHRLHYPINKLSGGEQQRVSVCRSLVTSPDIIFCDEPTGNLDHKNTLILFDYFKQIAKEFGVTFIIVSHSELLKEYTDQLIQLEDGHIV